VPYAGTAAAGDIGFLHATILPISLALSCKLAGNSRLGPLRVSFVVHRVTKRLPLGQFVFTLVEVSKKKGGAMLSDRVDGVVIGLLIGFDADAPLVVFAGNPKDHAIPARSLAKLDRQAIGTQVALLYEDGDRARPLIIGKIVSPSMHAETPTVVRDGDLVKIEARERIELRCGKAAIVLDKDGHITIRGTYVVSHASAANRIRGGSISLN
jgi:hypothetical protein